MVNFLLVKYSMYTIILILIVNYEQHLNLFAVACDHSVKEKGEPIDMLNVIHIDDGNGKAILRQTDKS